MKLEFCEIKKSFGEKLVLDGVSFSAESGSAFGLLGRNGAGKTTSIRILMNVFPADGGQILLDGAPIDYKKVGFGYLPEERGLYPKKKIFDQLVYFAELHGMKKQDAASSVDKWLVRLGMSEYRDKRLDTLSKGNQQKIQLVTALAHDPDIVILDEPFSGLDPVNARLLKDVVREVICNGRLVIFSSHQMNYIEEFCDAIAILHGGNVVLSGDLGEIKHSYPRNRLTVRSRELEKLRAALPSDVTFESDGDGVSATLTLPSPDRKAELMSALTRSFDIDEIAVKEPSLNDIFVEYAS